MKALVYFESQGLTYGGLNRSNVLLTSKGVVKIGTDPASEFPFSLTLKLSQP